eukprot:2694178-Rhodomonas_salina.4
MNDDAQRKKEKSVDDTRLFPQVVGHVPDCKSCERAPHALSARRSAKQQTALRTGYSQETKSSKAESSPAIRLEVVGAQVAVEFHGEHANDEEEQKQQRCQIAHSVERAQQRSDEVLEPLRRLEDPERAENPEDAHDAKHAEDGRVQREVRAHIVNRNACKAIDASVSDQLTLTYAAFLSLRNDDAGTGNSKVLRLLAVVEIRLTEEGNHDDHEIELVPAGRKVLFGVQCPQLEHNFRSEYEVEDVVNCCEKVRLACT